MEDWAWFIQWGRQWALDVVGELGLMDAGASIWNLRAHCGRLSRFLSLPLSLCEMFNRRHVCWLVGSRTSRSSTCYKGGTSVHAGHSSTTTGQHTWSTGRHNPNRQLITSPKPTSPQKQWPPLRPQDPPPLPISPPASPP